VSFFGPVLKKMEVLEAVFNITVSFWWQGIGEQELPHVGLKFWIF
jgi:hypothetical protein